MTDISEEQVLEAAKHYRRADLVPRELIWERLERARRAPARLRFSIHRDVRTASRAAAVIALLAVGAAGGVAVERMRQRPIAAAQATQPQPASGPLASYLASSDSLIRVFHLAAEGGRVRSDMGPWARDLLQRTRGFEASVPPADSTLQRLLADLDLVLVQIAQYASQPEANRMEITLIEDAIQARRVTAKLQAALRGSATGT